MGISICILFLICLIFSYIMNVVKEDYPKFSWLLFIPFCFPFLIVMNASADRSYMGSWLILFVIIFCFINIDRKIDDIKKVILFSIITALAVEIRLEHIILLAVIPFSVLFYKVFTIRKSVIFIILTVLFYGVFDFIGHYPSNENLGYELHNLTFIYEQYKDNKFYDKAIEENKGLIEKVFGLKEGKKATDTDIIFDYSDENECLKCIYLLTKFAIKPPISIYFLKKNFRPSLKYSTFSYCEDISDGRNDNNSEYLIMQKEASNINSLKQKITRILLYGQNSSELNTVLNFIYNPVTCLAIMILLIPVSIIFLKNTFMLCYSLIFGVILYIILIFGYYCLPLYYNSFIQNTLTILFIILIMLLNKYKLNEK